MGNATEPATRLLTMQPYAPNMADMKCPHCKGPSRVIDIKPRTDGTRRRRRECKDCRKWFSTVETKPGGTEKLFEQKVVQRK